ncbi:MAG: hypothetical protein WC485_08060 [Opitutaceae bacterium]
MKSLPLLILSLASSAVLCQKPSKSGDQGQWVTMDDFQTSVRKQLATAGVLDAYQASDSITVQLISSLADHNATISGKIFEDIIKPESEKIVLNREQRRLLFDVLSEDTTYTESLATCLCFFEPQLRVTFDEAGSKKHYDIFLSGVSHGEIQVIQGGRQVAYARTWHFIPEYLDFLDRVFPGREVNKLLRLYHENRMKGLANQAAEPTRITRGLP